MDTDRYLRRIGYRGDVGPTSDVLVALAQAHVQTVPFENFDIHLRTPIELGLKAIYDKIVAARRGGFCYELNGLFAELLRALGFEVELLSARVRGSRGLGPRFDHLTLRVVTEEGRAFLVDVGFGGGPPAPLPIAPGAALPEGDREHRLTLARGVLGYERYGRLGYEIGYDIDPAPQSLRAFEPMCRHHERSPSSWFTQELICTRATPNGRVVLSDREFRNRVGITTVVTPIATDESYLRTLREWFGIVLPRVPEVRGRRLIPRLHNRVLRLQNRVERLAQALRPPAQAVQRFSGATRLLH